LRALLDSFYPLLTLIGGCSSNETLLVLVVTAELDPELVFLIFAISFFDLNSSQRNNLSLNILLLGIV